MAADAEGASMTRYASIAASVHAWLIVCALVIGVIVATWLVI